ncbi:MAG: glycosyltransferase family 2 protein [Alphaproteobacteria bacterium]|nr:glycosyltransferase family 2 protein [Alphaproteobacteria bacterium]
MCIIPHEVPAFLTHEYGPKRHDVCVCVFVINEAQRLASQLERMRNVCTNVDIVIADGGSTDGSTNEDKLRAAGVNTLLVKTGPGRLGAQMRMAFDWLLKRGYKGVIVVDGNNKDGVEAIPLFLKRLNAGVDHVQGSRFLPGGHHENVPFSRLLGVRILHAPLMRWATGFPYTDTTNGFRAYSAKFLASPEIAVFRDIFVGYELHYYLALAAVKHGYACEEIPVSRVYPATGKTPTKISFFRGNLSVLTKLFLTVLGHYNFKPVCPERTNS